jgi:methylase of polypeptide subunit release factors
MSSSTKVQNYPVAQWEENSGEHTLRWRSEKNAPPPKKIIPVDDTITADQAYQLACEGTALLWRGDFQNAKQLLQALARRADRPSKKSKRNRQKEKNQNMADVFNHHRLSQSQRAITLSMIVVEVNKKHQIELRRAPDTQMACQEVLGDAKENYMISLRDLQGFVGAHEWRKKGIHIPELEGVGDSRIHPHYGVFSPVRGEYIQLLDKAPLPKALMEESLAFDIGTGTGVLAALLAKRGVKKIVATDQDPRALICANDNIQRLGLKKYIEIQDANLFPEGKAALIICNPPWIPGRPSAPIEYAIYDPGSKMLKGFLSGLAEHLLPNGEGWLILSDLAEHLHLRKREELENWIKEAGLKVLNQLNTYPTHSKALDATDPLYQARSTEITSLWRLAVQ